MKYLFLLLLSMPFSFAQNLSPEEQRKLLQEVQSLKERVNKLEKNDPNPGGLKSTDYQSKTTESVATTPAGPEMTAEQRKEIMETMEKYKKAQLDQQKALKELEDEE